jgi:hypothetical protein
MPPVIVYAGMSLWKVLLGGGKTFCMNILTGILAPFFFFATPAGKPVMVPDMFIWYKYRKNYFHKKSENFLQERYFAYICTTKTGKPVLKPE